MVVWTCYLLTQNAKLYVWMIIIQLTGNLRKFEQVEGTLTRNSIM